MRELILLWQVRRSPPLAPSTGVPGPHTVLVQVSLRYPLQKGRLLTCYSPFRHSVSRPLLRRSALGPSFDLHALSTPPAFVLSQDQTLRCKTLSYHHEAPGLAPSCSRISRSYAPTPRLAPECRSESTVGPASIMLIIKPIARDRLNVSHVSIVNQLFASGAS